MAVVDVRPVQEADASTYVQLLAQLDRESEFLLWEPGERALTVSNMREELASTNPTRRVRIVAASDGRLVGFLSALRGGSRRIQHRCDFTMGVLAAYRRQGIGRRLLEALEGWAGPLEVTRIELTVMAHNEPAISLYRRCGYQLEGTKHGAIRVRGAAVDELVMAKVLQ